MTSYHVTTSDKIMGADPCADRGICPPTFWSEVDALCFVPPTFYG